MLAVKPLNPEPIFLDDAFRSEIAETTLGFLRQLKGLTVFDIAGVDQQRTRVVTTLIHGNEPSGFIALHLWLRSATRPQTNLRVIICNPEAAQSKPVFSNRFIAGGGDLNRFFSADITDQSEGALRARQIKQLIQEVKPEAVVDLHNTSGTGPAFAVATQCNDQILDLASLFCRKMIITELNVGALMEQDFGAPTVTIECGGADDVLSHQVAMEGLHELFAREQLFDHHAGKVKIYQQPQRVRLSGEASVGFSHHALPTTDITLRKDIEKLNHEPTPKGEFIGWYQGGGKLPLVALDSEGRDHIEGILKLEKGLIFAASPLQIFMATTSQDIATSDCLFYVSVQDTAT